MMTNRPMGTRSGRAEHLGCGGRYPGSALEWCFDGRADGDVLGLADGDFEGNKLGLSDRQTL